MPKLVFWQIAGHPLPFKVAFHLVIASCLTSGNTLHGAEAGPLELKAAETQVVIAAPTLQAGPAHRYLLGDNYRNLWTTPIEVEVLDLSREGGGLTPLFRVGGAQTLGLAMKGSDGKSYTFRSLIKNQQQNLHEDLRDHVIGRIFQDQLATIHPASSVMVPPLAKAVGVLHNEPRLVVLPDDPALGEFRTLYAGRIGTIEQFPTEASNEYAGFAGATEIIKADEIVPLWLASPDDRVDALTHLRARLFDFFLGDWDRHANNYRWAKLPGKPLWQTLPEDRDQAFVDFQGALITLARPFEPRLLRFEESYPSSIGLTTQGWPIHRWFLAELERDIWIDTANDLRNRITDAVINEAVSLMPKPYFELNAEKLTRTLKKRRDNLPVIAERIYRYMSAEVDVQATDESDRVDLRDLGQGKLQVSVSLDNGSAPYFQRVFNADDTRSLRLFLRGGRNTLACHGLVGGFIKIDVVGSKDNDTLQECQTAKLRITETSEIEHRKTRLRSAPNPFGKISLPTKNIPAEADRPRDWRNTVVPVYTGRVNSDDGLVIGGGFRFDRFQYGKNPFGQRHTLTAGVSLSRSDFEAGYAGQYQLWNPKIQWSLAASATSIDKADFYGFGNDTTDDGDSSFFETEQTHAKITARINYLVNPEIDLFSGVNYNVNSTDEEADTLLNEIQPLGVGDFEWVNVFGGIDYDTRNRDVFNSAGIHFRAQGNVSPGIGDSDESFSTIETTLAGYFHTGSRSLLAVRVGAKHVSGEFPFQEAAFLGGRENLRGFDTNRFAGDASVFGNAEFRYTLGKASAFVSRAEYGVFVFTDVGRVSFEDTDESDDLHTAAGLGLSASALDESFLLSLAVSASDEGARGLFNVGFGF